MVNLYSPGKKFVMRDTEKRYKNAVWNSKSDVMPILKDLHYRIYCLEKTNCDLLVGTRFQRFSKVMRENWIWMGGMSTAAATIYKIITFGM